MKTGAIHPPRRRRRGRGAPGGRRGSLRAGAGGSSRTGRAAGPRAARARRRRAPARPPWKRPRRSGCRTRRIQEAPCGGDPLRRRSLRTSRNRPPATLVACLSPDPRRSPSSTSRPSSTGSTPAEALRNSLDLARHAERLGYRRYWVAEHHNMPGIASSAPAVLIAHLARVTSTIRVGSGGVMLPNHPPLVVAEQFGMLEALHPGRIDLGIGRAPGHRSGHRVRAAAQPRPPAAEDFPTAAARAARRSSTGTADTRAGSRATPGRGLRAGDRGCWAPATTAPSWPACSACRSRSRTTSRRRTRSPRSTSTAAASSRRAALERAVRDDRRAGDLRRHRRAGALARRRRARCRSCACAGPARDVPTPEEAAAQYRTRRAEQAFVDRWLAGHVVGSPADRPRRAARAGRRAPAPTR